MKNGDYKYIWNVLKHEGLFSDRKDDRGGITFRGVTYKTYKQYMLNKGDMPTKAHHKNLNEDTLLDIYLQMFIYPLSISNYNSDWVKEAVFSASMNHGGRNASKMVQRAAKSQLVIDGIIGPMTLKTVNKIHSDTFVNELTRQRIIFTDKIVRRDVRKGGISQVENLVGWHKRYLRFIRP